MKSIEIKRYQPALKKQWDDFIEKSQVDCFLFYRDFMEYHGDRFEDYSLIFHENNNWLAVFPAHIKEGELISHAGLTFGGFIPAIDLCLEQCELLIDKLTTYINQLQYLGISIKMIPQMYWKNNQECLSYFLFQKGFKAYRKDLNYVIDFSKNVFLKKTKAQLAKRGLREGFSIETSTDFKVFWDEFLIPGLNKKYAVKPVHTADEIIKLHDYFPQNIKLYIIRYKNEMLGGIVLFINRKVIKSQYLAVNELGKKHRASDLLNLYLIKKYQKAGYSYFDLGHVNTDEGKKINFSLAKYKEELGASSLIIEHYKWKS